MNLIFNLAKPEELEEIFEHFKKVICHMQASGLDQWDHLYPDFETIPDDIRKQELYLARIQEQIAVVFVMNQEMDEAYENGAWKFPKENAFVIHRLSIHPQFQKMGLGSNTMKMVEEMARRQGAESIRLDAFSQNQAALHLYRSLGFWETGYTQWRKGTFLLFEKGI